MDKSNTVFVGLVGTSLSRRGHNFHIVYSGVVH